MPVAPPSRRTPTWGASRAATCEESWSAAPIAASGTSQSRGERYVAISSSATTIAVVTSSLLLAP